ncbi:MAG: serine hydrolase [Bacilli bacterium]
MKSITRVISVAVLMFFLVGTLGLTTAQAKTHVLTTEAEAAILIDAATGIVLAEKNSNVALPIASMTKLMSEYLISEAIAKGKISWDDTVTVGQYAHEISQNTKLSNVQLELNGKYSVRELYEAMAIYSANGATIALAEYVAGTETEFVKKMNAKAEKLGLGEYKFVNATGLNNEDLKGKHPAGTTATDENMMSARATAALAYHLINEFPEVLEIASIPKKVFQEGGKYPIQMDNWNWMLPSLVYGYEGMDGLKTGSTPTAGYSFTGTAKRGEMRLISVVMKTDSYQARFDETKKILDYGFNNFELKEVYAKGDTLKVKQPVSKGKEKEISLSVNEDVVVPVAKGTKIKVKEKFVASKKLVDEDGALIAPIEKGNKVGSLAISADKGDAFDYVSANIENVSKVSVEADETVDKANFIVLGFRAIVEFFASMWDSVVSLITGWLG